MKKKSLVMNMVLNWNNYCVLLILQFSNIYCLHSKLLDDIGQCPHGFSPIYDKHAYDCIYKLKNDTQKLDYALTNTIQWTDGTIQHLVINVAGTGGDIIKDSREVILPNKWILTYVDPNGPFYYVSWRSDFKVLSLGLLNDFTNDPINVNLSEITGNCTIGFGKDDTIIGITRLLSGYVKEQVSLKHAFMYEYINFCFLTKFKWFDKSPWYTLKKWIGVPFQEFGYKCCMVRNKTVCCDDKLHEIEGYRLVPYVIGLFIVCFSPLIILHIVNYMASLDSEHFRNDIHPDGQLVDIDNKKTPVINAHPILLGLYGKNDLTETYLRTIQFPLCIQDVKVEQRLPGCLMTALGWFFIRWKRILFLVVYPVGIYIEFVLYGIQPRWKELLHELNENHINFGFTTALDGFHNKAFMPYIGPTGALIAYHVLGLLVLAMPTDFENSVFSYNRILLSASIKRFIHILSPPGIKGRSCKGYHTIRGILRTFVFLPLNPVFLMSKRSFTTTICRLIFAISVYPIIGLPIVPFCYFWITGYISFIYRKWHVGCIPLRRGYTNIQNDQQFNPAFLDIVVNVFKILVSYVLIFITFVVLIYYVYLCIVIFSYTTYFIIYIIYYISLAFIVTPKRTLKYLSFAIWGLIFLFQSTRDSFKFYKDIFSLVVSECEKRDKFMSTKGNMKYIETKIVRHVFGKIRPVYIEVGHIILKLSCVVLIYVSSFLFLNEYSDRLPDITAHISIVVTGLIPVILQYSFKSECPDEKFVSFIIECYQNREDTPDLSYFS